MAKKSAKPPMRSSERIVTCPAGHQFAVLELSRKTRSARKLCCPFCSLEMAGSGKYGAVQVQPRLTGLLSPPKKHLRRSHHEPARWPAAS